MRRAERLFRLVNEMQTRSVSRAEDLARHFEVNIRTIYRDIAHLQASGLPIDGEAGVGYLLRPGFDLPSITFTHDQLEALALGLSFVENQGDAALALAAREARAKIQANLPQPELRKLADAPYFTLPRGREPSGHAPLLRKAIRGRQVLQMAYKNGDGLASDRQVQPLALWKLDEGWMFAGWCALRQGFRVFRLDRIGAIAPTGDIFVDTPETSLRAFLAQDTC